MQTRASRAGRSEQTGQARHKSMQARQDRPGRTDKLRTKCKSRAGQANIVKFGVPVTDRPPRSLSSDKQIRRGNNRHGKRGKPGRQGPAGSVVRARTAGGAGQARLARHCKSKVQPDRAGERRVGTM